MNALAAIWVSRVLSTLVSLFLVVDGVMKLVRPAPVLATFAPLGLPESLSVALGILLLLCTVLYLVPRTAVLGAILLTGYLGGAAAIHLRVGNPVFSHVLFSVYLGIAVWLALWLRMPALRALVPVSKRQ